jgi:acetyl esterase
MSDTTIQTGLPGRLGDPAMNIGTDPRADARLVAAISPLGIDQHAPEADVDGNSPYADQLAFQAEGEQGFNGLIAHFYGALPPVAGVEHSTQTIEGVDGNAITLFVHRPEGVTGSLPGILHLHGGGMSIGTCEDLQFAKWRDDLAAAGLVVVGVEFRNSAGVLGPHPFPAGLDDCTSALHWMHANRERLGVSSIVVSGESGGANLALATVIKAKRDGTLDHIDGVFAQCPYISGAYAAPPPELPSLRENAGYFLSASVMGSGAGTYDPQREHTTDPLAWPYYAATADLEGLPPHMISVNEIDPLRDEGLAFHHKLVAAGVSSVCRVVAGTTHAADLIFGPVLPDLYQSAVRDVAGFAASR